MATGTTDLYKLLHRNLYEKNWKTAACMKEAGYILLAIYVASVEAYLTLQFARIGGFL